MLRAVLFRPYRLDCGFSTMCAGTLVLVNEPRCLAVQRFPLNERVVVCGRAIDCHVVVPNVTVSRRHAELHVSGNQVEVIDLASRNGTFLDGTRIEQGFLRLHGHLRLGEVAFVLSDIWSDEDCSGHFESVSTRRLPLPGADLPVAHLSAMQRHVLDLLLDGLSEKEIAKSLGISFHTAHNHVRNIYNALGLHSRAELLAKFVNKCDANANTGLHWSQARRGGHRQ